MTITLADTLAKLEPTEAMVRSVENLLKVWRARIKARNAKTDSLRRHKDPDFRARWQAGNDAHYGDPVKEAARIAKMRATRARKVGAFPLGFTTAMRSKVSRLVRKGVPRTEAIVAVQVLYSAETAPQFGVARSTLGERARPSAFPKGEDARTP